MQSEAASAAVDASAKQHGRVGTHLQKMFPILKHRVVGALCLLEHVDGAATLVLANAYIQALPR